MAGDPLSRDFARVTRALGLPAPTAPQGDPRTPAELVASVPGQLVETGRIGVSLLANAPTQIAEDLTIALNNLLKIPGQLAEEVFRTPGMLAQRLAPANLNAALATVRESSDFRGITNPKELREKMRTITDVLDLFTPT